MKGNPSRIVVLDAAVALMPVLAEPGHERATHLIRKAEVVLVPGHYLAECANVLWKYARKHGYPVERIAQDLADLRALPTHVVPVEELAEDAMAVALAAGITVYDALYVVLATRHGARLLTGDRELSTAAKAQGCEVESPGA